jgi:cyclic beta-1,2-glucan synthetase
VRRTSARARDAYVAAVEAHGWDGAWYRRAYFDDGTPLGSRESDECRIDSIAQSWSVISGRRRARRRQARAMRSLEEHLVDEDARLIRAAHAAVRPDAARSRLHQGLPAGRARERRAVHARRALGGARDRAAGDGDRAFELFQMLNPLHATPDAAEEVATYKVEPYVVAADVYTAPGSSAAAGGPGTRGGELDVPGRARGDPRLHASAATTLLRIEPRVPADWPEFTIEYRFGSGTRYWSGRGTSDALGHGHVSLAGRDVTPGERSARRPRPPLR